MRVDRVNTALSASDLFARLCSFLTNCGWILHDTISATDKVFKSNNSGNSVYNYIDIKVATTFIEFRGYLYWNAGTHTGSCQCYYSTTYNKISASGASGHIFTGDASFVSIQSLQDSSTTPHVSNLCFGFAPTLAYNVVTTLTADASLGDNAILTVTSTSGFFAGQTYQIVGINYEGRDKLTIGSITDSTHLVVSNLPRNYASGAWLGTCPSSFGIAHMGGTNEFYATCFHDHAGTETGLTGDSFALGAITTNQNTTDDSPHTADRTLLPGLFYEAAQTAGSIGFWGNNSGELVTSIGNTQEIWYTAISGERFNTIKRVGYCEANTLCDLYQSWTVNSLVGERVAILTGKGWFQTRKIVSNTADTLQISGEWCILPDNTSFYVVCHHAWLMSHTRVIPEVD